MQPTNVRQTEHQMGDYGNTNALQRCTHPSVKQKPSKGIEKIIYSYFCPPREAITIRDLNRNCDLFRCVRFEVTRHVSSHTKVRL